MADIINSESKLGNIIQNIRDSMRPFLTVIFSLTFCILVGISAWNSASIENAIDEVKVPLAMILTYHFTKGTIKTSRQ